MELRDLKFFELILSAEFQTGPLVTSCYLLLVIGDYTIRKRVLESGYHWLVWCGSSSIWKTSDYWVPFKIQPKEYIKSMSKSAFWLNFKRNYYFLMFHRIHPTCTNEPNVPDLNIFQTFDQRLHRLFPLCISVLMRWVTVPSCQLPFW